MVLNAQLITQLFVEIVNAEEEPKEPEKMSVQLLNFPLPPPPELLHYQTVPLILVLVVSTLNVLGPKLVMLLLMLK